MVGVLVILRPSPVSFDATSILPLGAALCFGTTVLLTRRLTRTESTFAILYWMMVIQAAFNAVGTVIYPSGDLSQIGRDPMLVGAAGLLVISGLSSQFLPRQGPADGEAVMVLSLDFLRVPIIAVIGWWLYGERLDGWVFAGFAIIAAGIVVGLTPRTRAGRWSPRPCPPAERPSRTAPEARGRRGPGGGRGTGKALANISRQGTILRAILSLSSASHISVPGSGRPDAGDPCRPEADDFALVSLSFPTAALRSDRQEFRFSLSESARTILSLQLRARIASAILDNLPNSSNPSMDAIPHIGWDDLEKFLLPFEVVF